MIRKPPTEIQRVGSSAIYALLLTCVFAVAAYATPQAASGSTTPNKSAPTRTPAAKTSSAHRKPATRTTSAARGTTGKSTSTARRTAGKSKGRRTSAKRLRGQQKIDSERAQSIQEALIREHYLSGEPTGTWNQASEDAMRKYQADHGWQSKQVPDSRALIKLGLGPSKDHLLNPESAMTTAPDAPRAESMAPVSHSADPGAPATPQTAQPDASGPQ